MAAILREGNGDVVSFTGTCENKRNLKPDSKELWNTLTWENSNGTSSAQHCLGRECPSRVLCLKEEEERRESGR